MESGPGNDCNPAPTESQNTMRNKLREKAKARNKIYKKALTISNVVLVIAAMVFLATFLPGCSGASSSSSSSSTKKDVSTNQRKVQTETSASISEQNKPNPKKTTTEDRMIVKSKAFSDGGRITVEYANTGFPGGKNISIPVEWGDAEGKSSGIKSYALSIIDRSAHDWVHWIVVDIPASTTGLEEGASGRNMPSGARELMNTFGVKGYGGPQPPAGSGDHIYEVTVYGLDVSSVDLDGQPSYKEFIQAIDANVIDRAKISGVLGR